VRVLTFLHSFEPGGVERVALRLVAAWRAQGTDAPLLMGREDGAMRGTFDSLDRHVPRRPPFPIHWCETLWMIVTLPGLVRRLAPDALFCAGNSYTVVAVTMKLLLGRRCPPILAKISNDLERRDMPAPVRWGYRLWLRVQGRAIDHFVGMETPMASEIAAAIAPRGAISIIPDPALSEGQIAALRAAPRPARGAGLRFVAVGRLAPQKNLPLMLRAFAQGARAADRLTIFGEGPERPALEALARTLGIADRVTFAGHVADPASRLPSFDIFLLSSDYEGVPAVVLEALAAGLPIIATQCSVSMSALLGHGRLGQLVEPGDLPSFAAAVNAAGRLTQDAAASFAMARRFTMERAASAYLSAFSTIVGPPGRARSVPAPLIAGSAGLPAPSSSPSP
jgi:glycosyltransferase involved in cell wall biosynthesis